MSIPYHQPPDLPASASATLRDYRRLVAQALSRQRRHVALQVALTALLAVIPSIQVLIVRYLFDAIVAALTGAGIARVALFLALQSGLVFGGTVIAEVKRKHLAWLDEHVMLYMKEPLLNKMQRIELTQFEQTRYFDAYARAQTGLNRGVQAIDNLLLILESLITTIAYAVVVSRIHWSLPVLLPLFALPSLFLGAALARRTVALNRGITPLNRAISYVETLLTSRHAAKELRIYQTSRYFLERFKALFWSGAKERQKILTEQIHTAVNRAFADQAIAIGITLFILWLAIRRSLSLGVYVALTQAIAGTQTAVETLTQKVTELYAGILQMADYFAFLQLPEEAGGVADTGAEPLPLRLDTIEAHGLSFTYPGAPEPALREISFRASRGEIVAIVGENGSGKTTLAKCLLGLYTPQAGVVRYDGQALHTLPRSQLYKRIAALFQDFVQYELTARENIGLGDLARLKEDGAIRQAAHAAQLDGVLSHLPQGLDTELGVVFGTGKELSMGQWQRFALARVFLKDAGVILLDEPTAALDPQSELRLFQRVKEVYQGDRILFLISHRLGICREVDRILVLQNGRLVENGTHAALMAQGGVYAELYRTQADLYGHSPDAVAVGQPQ